MGSSPFCYQVHYMLIVWRKQYVVCKFCKKVGIKVIKTKDLTSTLSDNDINLYVNFCDTNYALILESMDKGIPCILGNTDFFDNNKLLKDSLVLKSDDNINEIKEKINEVKKNKSKILKEYNIFRKKYSKKAKESLDELFSNIN